MRITISKSLASLGLAMLLTFTLSCSNGESYPDLPPPGEASQNYCFYPETNQCFPGSDSCPGIGGILALECSEESKPSGSGENSSSSSSSAELYAYCVFEADMQCLPGESLSFCPPGGTLSNTCPYVSSSSSKVNMSSSSGSSSSSMGSSSNSIVSGGNYFTDTRDNKRYKYEVAPNGTVWMSENLNYSKNGTIGYCYKTGNSAESLCNAMEDLYKCFSTEKNSTTCINFESEYPYCFLGKAGENLSGCDSPYGRAYTWEIAMDGNLQRGVCPQGWRIPSVAEWTAISGAGRMSNDFYVITGNFNVNGQYPPLGWKERTGDAPYGFYWTREASGSSAKFAGMQTFNGAGQIDIDAVATRNNDYFFVRCISDEVRDVPPPSSSSVAQSSSSSSEQCTNNTGSGNFIDPRDNNTYGYVTICNQTWMAENLNYDPGAGNSTCYNNSTANCAISSRYYDWATAMGLSSTYNSTLYSADTKHKGICPSGWHLPSDAEWTVLEDFVGSNARNKLKATSGWSDGGNGTDDYGFALLPVGIRNYSNGDFINNGIEASLWSVTENGSNNAWYRSWYAGSLASNPTRHSALKTYWRSVRCVKD